MLNRSAFMNLNINKLKRKLPLFFFLVFTQIFGSILGFYISQKINNGINVFSNLKMFCVKFQHNILPYVLLINIPIVSIIVLNFKKHEK